MPTITTASCWTRSIRPVGTLWARKRAATAMLERKRREIPRCRAGSEGWARLVSNQRPLACEASALPLSYAPRGRGSLSLRLEPLIDLHAHILPALDDGPADMETAVAMARVAGAAGTRGKATTSHV